MPWHDVPTRPGTDPSEDRDTPGSAVSRQPRLVLALDAVHPTRTPLVVSLDGVDQVLIERAILEPRGVRSYGRQATLSLDDDEVSRTHARVVADATGWHLVDLDSTNGTSVNHVRVQTHRLVDGDVIEIGNSFFVFREDTDEDSPGARPDLRSVHRGLAREYAALEQVAASAVPVLLRGETGTGK